jgi:hypothetical protein
MALIREGGRAGGRADAQGSRSLSLSHANACNPLLQAHLPWAQDNTRPRFPLTVFPPCVPSRADPSGLGHAATIYSSVQGPPEVETPTVGATGRGLLRVPRWLLSESTAPAPQWGTRRALTSRLRRSRASFPRNTPTPSRRTTPARSRRTCWALASYLR